MAAHYLATGAFVELKDPFGASLRHSDPGLPLKIWSVGRDGVDQGGLGDWSSESRDLVLELDR
jgi:hypothetical protein